MHSTGFRAKRRGPLSIHTWYDATYDPTDGNATGNGPSGLIYNTKTVQDLGGATSLAYGVGGAPRAPM
ncbi:MAG: hypothetical protein WCG85_15045, partial [Polyangia bacterium]